MRFIEAEMAQAVVCEPKKVFTQCPYPRNYKAISDI
jgi:hypothetical protein